MININGILEILSEGIKNVMEIDKMKNLQEIRIRVDRPLIFQIGEKELITDYIPSIKEVKGIIQRMSNYSIYAYDEEIKQGYITIKGGHRVGICGTCVVEGEKIKTIRNPASLNIRVCREVLGCAEKIMKYIVENDEVKNTIIISPPKCGKTTLLRDISKNISNGFKKLNFKGKKLCIIDERSEIASCLHGVPQLDVGLRTDVLDGCPKSQGIMMAIRSMAPDVIICDEIGTSKDIENIIKAMNSGVKLITSVHGYDVYDIYNRAVFKEAIDNKVFQRAVVLSNKRGAGTVDYIYDFREKKVIFKS